MLSTLTNEMELAIAKLQTKHKIRGVLIGVVTEDGKMEILEKSLLPNDVALIAIHAQHLALKKTGNA